MPLHITRAALWLPGYDLMVEMRRTLLHCDERMHEVVAVGIGERAWPSVESMHAAGAADVVVTTGRSAHTGAVWVEVAGAGRDRPRTPDRQAQAARLLALIDSGLSVDRIVRIMRQPDRRGR